MSHIEPVKNVNNATEIDDIIDQAIYESEQEMKNGAKAIDAEIVFAELEKKHCLTL